MNDDAEERKHPLEGVYFSFRGFKSFRDVPEPISFQSNNVVIGRNNSGKSAIADLLTMICLKTWDTERFSRRDGPFELTVGFTLDERTTAKVFPKNGYGGFTHGFHWDYGKTLIGKTVTRTYQKRTGTPQVSIPALDHMDGGYRDQYRNRLASEKPWDFDFLAVRVAAERQMTPESADNRLATNPYGRGVTNLIRAFITTAHLPREIIRDHLLADLNTIYQGNHVFDEVLCREDVDTNQWEVFLTEVGKGDIRLSQSGSSLQSVFIILAMVRLVPLLDVNHDWSKMVFIVEEPENNLHPALLRRLLDFLSTFRSEKRFTLIFTSHSAVVIDWAARRNDSQVLHVKQAGDYQPFRSRQATGQPS